MVPLTPVQIEQVVLNLGLLVADAQPQPGVISITLQKPGQGFLLDVGDRFAAVIMVSGQGGVTGTEGIQTADMQKVLAEGDEAGVILSVVKSMVEQAHGRMDQLVAPTGLCVYRVCLPHLDVRSAVRDEDGQADNELDRYVSRWKVLLGGAGPEVDRLKRHLRRIGTVVMEKETVVSLLAHVESSPALDVIVVDKRILGLEADGLLKAMLKLCPRVGIVVLGQDPRREPSGLSSRIVFAPYGLGLERMIRALVEAKGLIHSAGPTAPA